MLTYVYSCLHMFPTVNSCMFTYVYSCLIVFTYVNTTLPMFTPVYLSLPMCNPLTTFTHDYLFRLVYLHFIIVKSFMFTYISPYLLVSTC